MALSLEASMVSGTVTAVASCRVNVVGHMPSVMLVCHGFRHTTLAGVSRHLRLMSNVKETCTKRAWNRRVYCVFERGGAN